MNNEIKEKCRKSPKRLIINISEELHTRIKKRAATRNIPMTTWILRVLIREITKEEQYE